MAYALKLPVDVAALINEMGSWTLWQSRAARGGTPSCRAMLGGFQTMAERADAGRVKFAGYDEMSTEPANFFCWQSDLLVEHAEPNVVMHVCWGGIPCMGDK